MQKGIEVDTYMVKVVDDICDQSKDYVLTCLDPEDIGTDFHKEAEKMTLDEAMQHLEDKFQDYKNCGINDGEDEAKFGKIDPIFLIDIVIAAGILYDKIPSQTQK